MRPAELSPSAFAGYPPQARALAEIHVGLLRHLPLSFIPLLLREVINYDWKFPAEREELDTQFRFLQAQPDLAKLMAPFSALNLPQQLADVDWVNVPAEFSEQLSAHLWASGQIEAFRKASIDYVHELNSSRVVKPLPVPRLTIVMIGQGASASPIPLFRKLRPQGTLFTKLGNADNRAALINLLERRADAHPASYAHWWIDGGEAQSADHCTCVSYERLQPVCNALVSKMTASMQPGGGGPELLRSKLQRMRPDELGFARDGDPILDRFQMSLLTEGSGTQLFSTTFVQWAAREALRRAEPLTMLVRFAPRRQGGPVSPETLRKAQLDPVGALVDADMGAYYTWINQQRLAGAEDARLLAWYEEHSVAVAIGPQFKPGTQDDTNVGMQELIERLTAPRSGDAKRS